MGRCGRRAVTPLVFAAVFCAFLAPAPAVAGETEIHYAPVENLERVDVDLIRLARERIDMAAYTLTDWPVIGVTSGWESASFAALSSRSDRILEPPTRR
jgi:hypothetical protein